MVHHIDRAPEWLGAELLSQGSKLAQKYSMLDRVTSYDPSKFYVPLRWQHARAQKVHDLRIATEWPSYDPVSYVESDLPRKFKDAAILTADRQKVDDNLEGSGRQAVAYQFGEHQVMVGSREDGSDFFDTHGRYYQIALRLGNGVLRARMGVILPNEQFKPVAGDGTTDVMLMDDVRQRRHFV